MHLARYEEAQDLLEDCRLAFEEGNNGWLVGMADSALAELADATGDLAAASHYQAATLERAYATGQPEECALGHRALALYLKRLGTDLLVALAHDLAAAIIW